MNEIDPVAPLVPVDDTRTVAAARADDISLAVTPSVDAVPPMNEVPSHAVDPVRSAAGRLGGKRVHRLAELGREFEKEHGLTPGRQRQRQLVQLGKRYEADHGLRVARPRRVKQGDAWQEFLAALARVVKPGYRPAVEQLVAALRPGPKGIAAGTTDTEPAA